MQHKLNLIACFNIVIDCCFTIEGDCATSRGRALEMPLRYLYNVLRKVKFEL